MSSQDAYKKAGMSGIAATALCKHSIIVAKSPFIIIALADSTTYAQM